MNRILLGSSALESTDLIFGAWAIGGSAWGGNDEKESKDAVTAAIENGMNTIDTAPIYGFGKSEELIGEVINERFNREQVKIFTKCGINWKTKSGQYYFSSKLDNKDVDVYLYSGRDGIISECEDSLRRLKTDYIDLYQIHRPDTSTRFEESMEAMLKLKEEGKIIEIGVSNYSAEQLKESLTYTDIVSNQVSYSMLERGIESELIPFCIQNKVSILAYSPLQRGLLTGKYKGDLYLNEDDHRESSKWFKVEYREKVNSFLDSIKPIAENHNSSIAQLVLAWTVQRKGISCLLIGARNSSQVKRNIESGKVNLSSEEIREIDDLLEGLYGKLN